MSRFFINRPIVAVVISVLMVIIGAITIISLPVAQFPNIAPPEIKIAANYPGADAETMEKAVATPIEQQVNGVDNMDYMYSLNTTSNSGTALYIDFDLKTQPNADLLLAQSRQATRKWPVASRGEQGRHRREEVIVVADDAHLVVFPQRNSRCEVAVELRLHQSERADRAGLWSGADPDFRHWRVRHAHLG